MKGMSIIFLLFVRRIPRLSDKEESIHDIREYVEKRSSFLDASIPLSPSLCPLLADSLNSGSCIYEKEEKKMPIENPPGRARATIVSGKNQQNDFEL